MLIAIDHGNKQMKTAHHTFSSGLCESDTKPPFGENVLRYKGKYYTLSDQRIPYMRDKTKDDRFFILTLYAIAFELRYLRYPANETVDVALAVGLPPAHYEMCIRDSGNLALLYIPKSCNQFGNRTFARAGRANKGGHAPLGDFA